MAQWVQGLVVTLDSLSSVPETHVVEEENPSCRLSSDPHTRGRAPTKMMFKNNNTK